MNCLICMRSVYEPEFSYFSKSRSHTSGDYCSHYFHIQCLSRNLANFADYANCVSCVEGVFSKLPNLTACIKCSKSLPETRSCKEFNALCIQCRMLMLENEGKYQSHSYACESCRKIISVECKPCDYCKKLKLSSQLFNLPLCGDHKYCRVCINISSEELPSISFIGYYCKCASCVLYFTQILQPTSHGNCIICGKFAERFKCSCHDYCNACKASLVNSEFTIYTRITNCNECQQALTEEKHHKNEPPEKIQFNIESYSEDNIEDNIEDKIEDNIEVNIEDNIQNIIQPIYPEEVFNQASISSFEQPSISNTIFAVQIQPKIVNSIAEDIRHQFPESQVSYSHHNSRVDAGNSIAPSYQSLNGVYHATQTIANEACMIEIQKLTTNGTEGTCNCCNTPGYLTQISCKHWFCVKCIAVQCAYDISEFDDFLVNNDLNNLRGKFSYRCRTCMGNFTFPTALVFRLITVLMELYSRNALSDSFHQEYFTQFYNNRFELIKFLPYFDGLKAVFIPCKCKGTCLRLGKELYLCRNHE